MINNDKETILIAGGTGLVGNALVKAIDSSKYNIILLTRTAKKSDIENIKYVTWSPSDGTIEKCQEPDYIINLAGAGIADQRWTENRKNELILSRVNSAKTLKCFIFKLDKKPKVYISASAVGYYGHRGNEVLTESSLAGNEFMSECCVAWENSANEAANLCDRKVILRIGIVLSTLGGALPKMLMTKKLGILNYFGSGDQYYPWIHIEDLVRLILSSMESEVYSGIYNAVASDEVTNKGMMTSIKEKLNIFGLLLPAPTFALRIALGEMANVILNSNRVISERLPSTGFTFNFNNCGYAVKDLTDRKM